MSKTNQNISDVIQHHLNKWNNEYIVKYTKTNDYGDRLARTMTKFNKNLDKLNVTIDGVEFDNGKITKLAIPSAFKLKPVTFESFASDGSSFAIEVS